MREETLGRDLQGDKMLDKDKGKERRLQEIQ